MVKEKAKVSGFRELSLRNFRGFRNVKAIPLAPLTFLVGPNSSGKSSVADAILLAAQSDWLPGLQHELSTNWIGRLVDLGSYADVVFNHDEKRSIKVGLTVSFEDTFGRWIRSAIQGKPVRFEIELRSDGDNPVGRVAKLDLVDCISEERISLSVGTGRRGQLRFRYKDIVSPLRSRREPTFAYHYRNYIYRIISQRIDTIIDREKSRIRGSKSALNRLSFHAHDAYSFLKLLEGTQRVSSGRGVPQRWYSRTGQTSETNRWSREVRPIFDAVDPSMIASSDGASNVEASEVFENILKKLNIADTITRESLSAYHESVFVRDNITGIFSNIIDVGFGASQIMPVIAACLEEESSPLFIEQPEIHLHPKAQGAVADLLAQTSRHRQVFVETHSVHLINKVRIMVAKGEVNHEDIIINYVDRKRNGSQVTPIYLAPDGEFIGQWPEGFFDERYDDTLALLKLRKTKSKD